MPSLTLVLLALTLIPSAETWGQSNRRIRVQVAADSNSGGLLLESALAGALRSLGDVDVIGNSEQPDYMLRVVVLCDPNCTDALQYSAALLLTRPIYGRELIDALLKEKIVYQHDGRVSRLDAAAITDLYSYTDVPHWAFWRLYTPMDHVLHLWVQVVGRLRVQTAAQELVAENDSRCFRLARLSGRMAAITDTTARTAIAREYAQLSQSSQVFSGCGALAN